MHRTTIFLFAAVLLSFGGAFLSGMLLNKHMGTPGAPAWLNALCESGEGGSVSCDKVLASRWAWIPPKKQGDPKDKVRYPVAGLGTAYYIMLLTWFVGVGRCSYASRRWHLLPLILNACGILGSSGFVFVMAFELDKWCPLCLAIHAINGLLLVVNILLRPRTPPIGPQAPRGADRNVRTAAEAVPQRHPSLRLSLVVIGLGVLLVGWLNQGSRIKGLLSQNRRMRTAIEEVQRSAEALLAVYQSQPAKRIIVRPDDPIRHNAPGLPAMIVWSDFECTHCRKFAVDFENKYYKEFEGFLRIVYKHFSFCMDCNKYSKTRMHPNSCKAARIAEAVRLQGGNEKFWQVHDLLFEQQDRLEDLDPRGIARALDLDPARLIADMDSVAVKKRIAEDIDQGHTVGVTAIPAVFLGGRKVSSLARSVPAFWKLMAGVAKQAKTEH